MTAGGDSKKRSGAGCGDGHQEEAPRILRAVATRQDDQSSRRAFMLQALAASAGALGGAAAGCNAEVDIEVDENGNCRCHAVCSCDVDDGENGSQYATTWEGEVCTCNTVCTCDTVSTGSSGGGGYTYYYPN